MTGTQSSLVFERIRFILQLSQVTPTKLCTLRSHLMGRRYFLRFKYPFVNADKFELDYRGLHLRFVLIFEVELNLSYDTWFVFFNIFNDPSTLDSSVSSKKSEISRLLLKTEAFQKQNNF
ncbi:hypothetical protein YC2023_067384 [Brassica napus]